MNSVDNSTIVSLHRPFHGPLWVARWVCEFVRFYKKDSNGGRINSADFFLFYIFRLKKLYDKHDEINEYVSRQTIEDVCGYFAQLKTISQKKNALDVILHSKKSKRVGKLSTRLLVNSIKLIALLLRCSQHW